MKAVEGRLTTPFPQKVMEDTRIIMYVYELKLATNDRGI